MEYKSLGLAKVKEEGKSIHYGDTDGHTVYVGPAYSYVERRCPDHLLLELEDLIDKFLTNKGYPNF